MQIWEIENSICYFKSRTLALRDVNYDYVFESGCSLLVVTNVNENMTLRWIEETKCWRSQTYKYEFKKDKKNSCVIRVNDCSNVLRIWARCEARNEVKYYKGDIYACEMNGDKIILKRCKIMQGNDFIVYEEEMSLMVKKYNFKKRNKLHFPEMILKVTKKKIKIRYYDQCYQIDNFSCTFCFKEHENIEKLMEHINMYHFYHFAEIIDNVLCIRLKSQKEIKDSLLHGIIIHHHNTLQMFFKPESGKEYHKTNFLFIKYPHKRGKKIEIKKLPKIKYYPETMDINICNRKGDWVDKVVKYQIKNIVDSPHIKLMKQWNVFIAKGNFNIDVFNIRDTVIKFIKNTVYNSSTIDFLGVLYRKAILSRTDIRIILEQIL